MQYKLNICVLARAFIFLEEKKKNSEQTSSTVTLPKQILIFHSLVLSPLHFKGLWSPQIQPLGIAN